MGKFELSDIKGKLYIPPPTSHKGQNGKLLIIGGSHLFHAASLWAAKIASRIVDMVFYHSVPENLEIVKKIKSEFYDGIVVPVENLEDYINEVDCILVGPGMERTKNQKSKISARGGSAFGGKNQKHISKIKNIKQIQKIEPEGVKTRLITEYLLRNYPHKKFVIDAGSLQMMETEWLKGLKKMPILTPHEGEFNELFNFELRTKDQEQKIKIVKEAAKKYNCVILLKGPTDIVCSPEECKTIKGGNSGMTKGGTGDVLAGLVAALYCKNEAFLSAIIASFINKKAGENLFKKIGYYFNASDLICEIPKVLKELIPTSKV